MGSKILLHAPRYIWHDCLLSSEKSWRVLHPPRELALAIKDRRGPAEPAPVGIEVDVHGWPRRPDVHRRARLNGNGVRIIAGRHAGRGWPGRLRQGRLLRGVKCFPWNIKRRLIGQAPRDAKIGEGIECIRRRHTLPSHWRGHCLRQSVLGREGVGRLVLILWNGTCRGLQLRHTHLRERVIGWTR